jgi:hypothetical protein
MSYQQKVRAASGDAEITGIVQSQGTFVQIGVEPISGSGTVTLTVKGAGETTYKTLTDGTIDLGSPQTVTVNGKLSAVKATSSSLDYDLIVTAV